ncbi:helix-turn-helix domain-containing protein, partial [Mycobacterium sp. Lab-001]
VVIPDGTGCAWRDVLVAVATATVAFRFRFGAGGLLGAVTPDQVAVAASGGRLLAPRWSPPRG